MKDKQKDEKPKTEEKTVTTKTIVGGLDPKKEEK
jgi:hypothetical protein